MTPTPDPAAPAVEVVEAMARAAWGRYPRHPDTADWESAHDNSKKAMREIATAFIDTMRTHLAANPHHAAALLPEGWVAVPREPTAWMIQAAFDADLLPARRARHVWEEMIEAALAQPAAGGDGDE